MPKALIVQIVNVDSVPTPTEPMVCWQIIATIRYCRSEHQHMDYRIVPVCVQPELAPIVAEWLLGAFGHPGSPTFDGMIARIMEPRVGPEETFVLFEGDIPVATASLARHDLDSRPDLTRWLAGVFVEPAFRQRGYATALLQHVEARAMAASVSTLWLNTWTAEPLYVRLGWQRAGLEKGNSQEVVLMRRSLFPSGVQIEKPDRIEHQSEVWPTLLHRTLAVCGSCLSNLDRPTPGDQPDGSSRTAATV